MKRVRKVIGAGAVGTVTAIAVVSAGAANGTEPSGTAQATGAHHGNRPVAAADATDTYADYSRITERSAGQFWSGGAEAGQWSWRTDAPGEYSISWDRDEPESRERFVRSDDGAWLLLDGWSDNGTYYTQRVTSESIGDADCTDMRPVPPDGGRQHYVRWNTPDTGYCLDARGTITEKSSGTVIDFRHRQVWSPPEACSNAHFSGRVCIKQHETWWDDNQHPWQKTRERDVYLAEGLGMAFKVRQSFPSTWGADLRYVWDY